MHFYYSVSVRTPTAMLKIRNSENKGTHEKIKLNFNVTYPKLVHMCGYKLPIIGKNLA